MKYDGFNVDLKMDLETGFIFGGNDYVFIKFIYILDLIFKNFVELFNLDG